MTVVDVGKPVRTKFHRRRRPLGEHVAGVVLDLQSRVLRERQDPAAISALARLRRGIGREPGSDFTLESYLFVPEDVAGFIPHDGPADAEYAVHDAVTLYALHQQSQRKPMFAHGNGLGIAASMLADRVEGGRRRFAALGTAATYAETVHHLRNLTTLLRTEEIPLDYGLLADDLATLRSPDGAAKVRAIWGREYFRARPRSEAATESEKTSDTEENAS